MLNELLATKLRALYQRRKGRDLFDLWICIKTLEIDCNQVVNVFRKYNEYNQTTITRAQFEMNLKHKISNDEFLDDVKPLLSPDILWDPTQAYDLVMDSLIKRLPGEPWRGMSEAP